MTKLTALLELVGLRLEATSRATSRAPARHALLMPSRTAGVSYKTPLEPGQLAKAPPTLLAAVTRSNTS